MDDYNDAGSNQGAPQQLFEPVKAKKSGSAKKANSANKHNLGPVKNSNRSRSSMDQLSASAQANHVHDKEVRLRDEQIKVLTEANMELATKLQLLEEAMVGADTIMVRRTEMMRALAEENEDLLAMVENNESTGPGQAVHRGESSMGYPPTDPGMTPPTMGGVYTPTQSGYNPGEAWPERIDDGLMAGDEGDYFGVQMQEEQEETRGYKSMPGVQEARLAIESGVQKLTRHRPLIGQEERAVAMGAMNEDAGAQYGVVEMRDIIGQIEGLDREIFDGAKETRKKVEKLVPLQMIDEKEVVRLRVETHALRMFKLKCNEEIAEKEHDMQLMGQDLASLKKTLAASESGKNQLAEQMRLHEERVRQMTDQYAMMTNRYHDEEELRVRLAEELRATEAKVKILEEEAFIMRTRNSAVVNRWVKARHRAVEHELKEQLEETESLLVDEENGRAKAEEDLQRKQLELEMMRERHHCLLNDLASAQEETKKSRKAREEAEEKTRQAEEKVKEVTILFEEAEAKNAELYVTIDELQARIKELENVKEALMGKVKELEKEIADLKKTLQQIYQKHAEQLKKLNEEWEEKTGVLKAYIKNKDEECRGLTENNTALTKSTQLQKVQITELEKIIEAKIEELKVTKDQSMKAFEDMQRQEKMKQDVLKTYARTKEAEIRETRDLLETKTKEFQAEELRRQKGDAQQKALEEDHRRLEKRYASLQNGYDREMSSRERLEQTILEQERGLRTELQKNDQYHRKKFQDLGEKMADCVHKLNFECAAREDAEMALIHKQEEIFELRSRNAIVQEAKDQADKLQTLVDEESKHLHARVRELLLAIESAQKAAATADERAQRAEKLAVEQIEQVRSETNMILEQKLQELRVVEDNLEKANDEIMAMTIAIENERLQAAKDLAERDDEIAKLKTKVEELSFKVDELETTVTKCTEDADIALREVQALRERNPEGLSSLKDEKIRNLDALEKSLEARLKKTEDARVLAITEQRSKEKEVRDVKIELMEKHNELEQFKREFLSKEELMKVRHAEAAEGGGGGGGANMTDIDDPVDRQELRDAQDKLDDAHADVEALEKQLRVVERALSKWQGDHETISKELHKFILERENEVEAMVSRKMDETQGKVNAESQKERDRIQRKKERERERDARSKADEKDKKKKGGTDSLIEDEEDKYSDEDKEKFKKIFELVRYNKYKDVEKMVKDGCPVDWRDSNGYTSLMVAAQNGLKRIIKSCMRFNCNLDAQNHRGHTACHLANMYSHGDLLEYMVSKGANDSILNEKGQTCHEATK